MKKTCQYCSGAGLIKKEKKSCDHTSTTYKSCIYCENTKTYGEYKECNHCFASGIQIDRGSRESGDSSRRAANMTGEGFCELCVYDN